MTLIYTSQKSKLTKKQKAKRDELLSQQRAVKRELAASRRPTKLGFINPTPAHRTTSHIPSLDTGRGSTAKPTVPTYTGTAMIGIGQMHKSNAVPVFKQEDAVAIASMRR